MQTGSSAETGRSPLWWWPRAAPWLLILAVVAAYQASLHGGFLNWDDPWLYRENRLIHDPSLGALRAIWTDLGYATRAGLGAEYLPVRDTELWLEAHLLGLGPTSLRITNLVIYAAAVSLMRIALRNTLKNKIAAELAAWVFALHPLHVESVAWLAGRKDVLALLFVAAALAVYSTSSRHRVWSVPLLLSAAYLSKSMSVSAGGLLVAQSFLAKKKPDPKLLVPAFALALGCFALHLHVGHVVGIVQRPLGGSRITQLLSMGPVWLRYLWLLVYPPAESLVHDIVVRTHPDLASIGGYAVLVVWGVGGALLATKRDERVTFASFLWFVVPLLPVSQVLYPLQSQMADRYLFLSVMALALPCGVTFARLGLPGIWAGIALVAVAAGFTAARAKLFSESAEVFADAVSKTEFSPVAPYQLGLALEDQGDLAGAERAFETAISRAAEHDEVGRRATNNLARLLAIEGKLDEAEHVLRAGLLRWPEDPKMQDNLDKVVKRRSQHDESRAP